MKIILTTLISMLLFTAANAQTPTFAKYAAKVETATAKKIKTAGNKDANDFRTTLRKSLKSGVNFGGHYTLSFMGCGTGCLITAIIDAKTGDVYFPDRLFGTAHGYGEIDKKDTLEYRKNSRLIIVNGYPSTGKRDDTQLEDYGQYYYEWTGTELKLIKFVAKKKL